MDSFEFDETDFNYTCGTWMSQASELSKFDEKIRHGWDRALDGGHFRYKLDIETRIIGEKNYVAQLNVKRAQERRKPDAITTVNQPFNPASFNFTKIRDGEILFELARKSKGCQSSSPSNGSAEEGTGKDGKRKRHLAIINVSPLEYGHILIVPDVDACRPQILTEEAVQMSIECMLLSKHRGFHVGFNSLCAYASVNHLHVHTYYLERELFIDTAPVEHICDNLYELVCMPVKAFAFQLHNSDLQQLSRLVYQVTAYFQQNEIAHNVFLTRGLAFDQTPETSNDRTVRLFLWPRKKFIGTKDEAAFNVAVAELAGHLPIKIQELYEGLDEQQIEETMLEARLDDEEYNKIKQAVTEICQTASKHNTVDSL